MDPTNDNRDPLADRPYVCPTPTQTCIWPACHNGTRCEREVTVLVSGDGDPVPVNPDPVG